MMAILICKKKIMHTTYLLHSHHPSLLFFIGFYRYRVTPQQQVHQRCSNAIEHLNKFKDVTWPPQKRTFHQGNSFDVDDNSIDLNDTNVSSETETTHSTIAETKKEEVELKEETKNGDKDEGVTVEEGTTDDENDNEMSNVNIGIATVTTDEEDEAKEQAELKARIEEGVGDEFDIDDEDEDEMEPELEDDSHEESGNICPEVKIAISCYCTTITHPNANAKMIEIALECIGLLISNRYVVGSTANKGKTDLEESDESDDDYKKDADTSDVMHLINCICACAENPADAVQSAMTKALFQLMTSPVCSVHEAGMLKSVRTVFHIYLITKHDEVKDMSRSVLLDMLRSVFQRMEAYDAMIKDNDEGQHEESVIHLPKGDVEDGEDNQHFASMFHTDSYLLFRALCKLSAKPLPEDVDDQNASNSSSGGNLRVFSSSKTPNDPMATATKILSLELILCVFEHCGPAFREGDKFIYAVQNFLCVSLLKNCVSSNTVVAHLSLKVFLLLVSLHQPRLVNFRLHELSIYPPCNILTFINLRTTGVQVQKSYESRD